MERLRHRGMAQGPRLTGIRRDRPFYIVETADGFGLNFHNTLPEIPFAQQIRLAIFAAVHAHRDIEVDDPYPYLPCAWQATAQQGRYGKQFRSNGR
jgi:hypothetical protein